MKPFRLSFLIGLAVFLSNSLSSFAQSDLDAKAAMIDGLEAYRAGSPSADSLLALGIAHSELAPVAEYNLGRSLVQTGDTARAQAAFRKAIGGSEDPALRSSAWHNLGNLSLQQQSLEPAIQAYKQALREDPTNAAARYNLAYAMRLAQQQQQQQDQQQSSEEQEQESDEEQESQDGDQEQEGQDGDQEQEGQDGDQEQEGQDGDQEQEGQDGDQEQEGQDGDQEQEGQQEQQAPSEPVEGQISPEDMERILESLERNEAAIQAKLQRQRGQGTPRKIEKDW